MKKIISKKSKIFVKKIQKLSNFNLLIKKILNPKLLKAKRKNNQQSRSTTFLDYCFREKKQTRWENHHHHRQTNNYVYGHEPDVFDEAVMIRTYTTLLLIEKFIICNSVNIHLVAAHNPHT